MALESVVKEIIAQAETQADAIVKEGMAEAAKVKKSAKEKADAEAKKFNTETQKLVEDMKKMEISSLNLHLNKELLNSKKEIIESTYLQSVGKISKISQTERQKVLRHLMEKAMKELPAAKYFYSNENDKAVVKKMFPELTFQNKLDCLGGVVLENADRTVRTNHTFEIILNKVKEENLNEISKRTFG